MIAFSLQNAVTVITIRKGPPVKSFSHACSPSSHKWNEPNVSLPPHSSEYSSESQKTTTPTRTTVLALSLPRKILPSPLRLLLPLFEPHISIRRLGCKKVISFLVHTQHLYTNYKDIHKASTRRTNTWTMPSAALRAVSSSSSENDVVFSLTSALRAPAAVHHLEGHGGRNGLGTSFSKRE
jgi:hypothetical protein